MLTKKKRVSKKTKSSWRKHVNINDVEEFLDDQRFDERLGLNTLKNEELFVLDTKPQKEKQVQSITNRKRKVFDEPPKCFAILQSDSKIPDPNAKRNHVRTKEERKNILIKNKEASNLAKGILKNKEIQAIKDRKVTETIKQSQKRRGDFNENIWDEDTDTKVENDEWLNNNTKKHTLIGLGKKRKTVRAPQKKNTSILPSVEVPHPGMSYNPSFEDHQALLKEITEKETQMIKKEAHLNRVTSEMFSRVLSTKRDSDWLVEMSQGLPSEPKVKSEDESDNEYKPINPPVRNKKKTLQQKRKQREERDLKFQRKTSKKEKQKVSDIHQLRSINKKILKNVEKTTVLREKRLKLKEIKAKEPKQLGAVKFEEPDLEFKLGHEITGNLINLKKEGNLLAERFKSLQKRNIIQPAGLRHKRKSKVKKYTKPGHKEDWKTTVAKSFK